MIAASISSPASSAATYELKVELSGFKAYERQALVLSPSDSRGIDVRLEVGQQIGDGHGHRAAGSDSDRDRRT